MQIKKFVTLIILVLAWTGTVFAGQDQQIQQKLAALEKIRGKFTFIVLGDNRSGDDVYRKLLSRAMDRKPDLIMNTGDLIATPGNLDDWAKFWEMSKMVTVPYFLTVGNHDVHPKVPGSEKIYKEQVDLPGNELFYSFTAGNSLFVVLDSYIDDQEKKIIDEQYKWLEGVLAGSSQRHKFVFLHHPLYPEKGRGKHYGNSLDRYPPERDALQALFVKYKVDAVFAGHEHYYLRKTFDGIIHVITGGGGAPVYGKDEDGGFYHFVQVTVDGDKVSGEVVDINGKRRDRF
jgi:3',5'-cyclic AMP phosphodiesterase CpdA